MIRQIIEHVYDQVTRTRHPLDPPLLVVLDEAANIAPLSDLDALASTAAGHGIQLVTIWHDLAQINARYGTRAATVANNHRAKLFLSGISDPSTLDYASHLIGEEEVMSSTLTVGGRNGPSSTRTQSVRRLAPPDALRRTRAGRGRSRLRRPSSGPASIADVVRRPVVARSGPAVVCSEVSHPGPTLTHPRIRLPGSDSYPGFDSEGVRVTRQMAG